MKQRVAVFQRGIDSTWLTVWGQPPYNEDGDDWHIEGYFRISEWVDVDFAERRAEDIIPQQIAALDRKAEEVKAEFTRKLQEIAQARATLLAITHQPESP